jgi:two-component system, chemotaxis family, response regulator Rcp1
MMRHHPPCTTPGEILVVDDNAGDVRLLKEAFKECFIDSAIHVTRDGEQALAFLKHEGNYRGSPRPALILLDLNLPRKDGREVLAEIKQEQSLRGIPVVVFSTSRQREDVHRAYDLHANCYIPKPDNLDSLIDIGQLLQKLWFSTALLAE